MSVHIISKDDIWYASEKRAKAIFATLAYDSIGTLEYDTLKQCLSFRSKDNLLETCDIVSIDWGNQKLNWGAYLIAAIPLTLGMAGRHDSLLYAIVMTSVGVLFGILFGYLPARKWIKVTYRDSRGNTDMAYFFDGGYLGYRGVFGGTRQLFDALEVGFYGRES